MTTVRAHTIEQILQIRLRAAELRVLQRAEATVKTQAAINSATVPGDLQNQLTTTIAAKRQAEDAVALVRREIAAQRDHADPVEYEPAAGFTARRYAAVLLLDNPELTPAEALAQTSRDEAVRLAEYRSRVLGADAIQSAPAPVENPDSSQPQSWDQRVLDGLRHVLAPIQPDIEADDLPEQEGWNALVRRVREACQAGDTTPVEILRRLGRSTLMAVDDVELPNTFLAAKVRDWTPDND